MAITLYGEKKWYSPYVFTAFIALKEKGLKFETKELDLSKKETFEADYLNRSITAKVPALEHDGFWLAESLAIAEYVAETFPHPDYPRIFPVDLKERGRARQLMMWIRTDLLPLRQERTTETMFFGKATAPLSDAAKTAAESLVRVVSAVLPDGKTQLFSNWSIADADMAFCLQRLGMNGYELPKKLRAFIDAQWSRASVQAFVNHPRPKL
jgi:glutathione S-transferase